MIITKRQQAELDKHFRSVFQFRETYEEVYDHLLAAVNNAPANTVFETVVNQTIAQDFGGYKALRKLEERKLRDINRSTIKIAWQYFVNGFKPFAISFACLYGTAIYYLMQFGDKSNLLLIVLVACILFPYVLLNIWRFRSAYVMKDSKKSIFDVVLARMAIVPYQITFLSLFLIPNIQRSILFKKPGVIGGFTDLPPLGVSIIFTLIGLYCFSFYTWYKKGFKLKTT